MTTKSQWDEIWLDLRDSRNALDLICSNLPWWADSAPCLGLVDQVDRSVIDREPVLRAQASSGPEGEAAVWRLLWQTRQTLDAAAQDLGTSLSWSALWQQVGRKTMQDAAAATTPFAAGAGIALAAAALLYILAKR